MATNQAHWKMANHASLLQMDITPSTVMVAPQARSAGVLPAGVGRTIAPTARKASTFPQTHMAFAFHVGREHLPGDEGLRHVVNAAKDDFILEQMIQDRTRLTIAIHVTQVAPDAEVNR
jgi:hypothetical protein